jgi:HD-GYP domain-containing protein (c-di-GMP phosphodiesterase class II)
VGQGHATCTITMSSPKRNIDVELLRIGMYVSELDRPWLETPFLFQGFHIRTDNEIHELQRYCTTVEIDIEQSDASLQAVIGRITKKTSLSEHVPVSSKRLPLWQRFLLRITGKKAIVNRQRVAGEYYKDTVTTKDELVTAKNIHADSLQQLMKVLSSIRQGATIAMPDLEVVANSMVDSVLRNGTAMALLARMAKKDEYTSSHSLASSIWALVFGRHLGLDRESLEAVGLGALLLDVGKTKLPEELLNKTGELTIVERSHIQNHIKFGLDIIREADSVDQRVLDMVATHHERFDGSGYPKGWQGNQIPVFGRIGGIVDSYSAMTSKRPYAPAMSSFDAMREFTALADKHFQAEMVEQFIQAVGIFPAGTLVELNTGEVGVVLKEHQSTRLQPEIAVILDAEKKAVADFETVDLRNKDGVSPTVWIERGINAGDYNLDPRKYFL